MWNWEEDGPRTAEVFDGSSQTKLVGGYCSRVTKHVNRSLLLARYLVAEFKERVALGGEIESISIALKALGC